MTFPNVYHVTNSFAYVIVQQVTSARFNSDTVISRHCRSLDHIFVYYSEVLLLETIEWSREERNHSVEIRLKLSQASRTWPVWDIVLSAKFIGFSSSLKRYVHTQPTESVTMHRPCVEALPSLDHSMLSPVFNKAELWRKYSYEPCNLLQLGVHERIQFKDRYPCGFLPPLPFRSLLSTLTMASNTIPSTNALDLLKSLQDLLVSRPASSQDAGGKIAKQQACKIAHRLWLELEEPGDLVDRIVYQVRL